MTSLRNSLHRRNHKERSQLAHRSKFGLLEKHSDYVLRARDYHSKQGRLIRLRQKAAERNKDEFYFSMKKERTKGGVHVKSRGNVAIPVDIVKVLKTQDENYVRTMRLANLKKIDSLKTQLMTIMNVFTSDSSGDDKNLDENEYEILSNAGILPKRRINQNTKHIIFVGNEKEAQSYRVPSTNSKNTPNTSTATDDASVRGWRIQVPKRENKTRSSSSLNLVESNGENLGQLKENRIHLLKELYARLVRNQNMIYAERELEMQRLMMGKGARKKLKGAEKISGPSSDDEEDDDEIDARKGKQRNIMRNVNEKTYRPRMYKWGLERKR